MSESEPILIGDIIRQRRAELGLSPAELGEKVGRTGSTVRRWEKNDAAPPDSVLAALATALELDRGQLTAPGHPASSPPAPPATTQQADAKAQEPEPKAPEPKAPEPEAKAPVPPPISSPPPVRRPETSQSESSATPRSEERPSSAPPRSAPPPPPKKQPLPQPTPPLGDGAPATSALPASDTGAAPITELPTEVMAVPPPELTPEPAAAARLTRTRTVPRQEEAALSYVEDPRQRYRYFLRWSLTAVAIVVMLFVLAWAFTELKEALGDVWDLFQEEPSETTIVGVGISGG